MKKQRLSQHGGKTRASAANPAISQRTDDNGDFGSPIPSSTAITRSTKQLIVMAAQAAPNGSAYCVLKPNTFIVPDNLSYKTPGVQKVDPIAGTNFVFVHIDFKVKAEFTSNENGADCHCCQYRQYIKGKWEYLKPGRTVWEEISIPLGTGSTPVLNNTFFQEDVNKQGQRFGHREDTENLLDNYYKGQAVDRENGCRYEGDDKPGWTIDKTWKMRGHVEFTGIIADICNSAPGATFATIKRIATKTWKIDILYPAP